MKCTYTAVLPLALALAAPIATLSSGAEAARIVNQKAVENDQPYNGVIVRYKVGTSARMDFVATRTAVSRSAVNLVTSRAIDTSAKAKPKAPFSMEVVRKLANEAHLIRLSRKLTRSEGLALLNELAANPDVDYVEPNLIFQHQLLPNDSM